MLQVTPNLNIDPALYDHLADCPDTRFLAVLLFARLVSLTVFHAVDDPTSADERRRESNIAQAGVYALLPSSSPSPHCYHLRLVRELTSQHAHALTIGR